MKMTPKRFGKVDWPKTGMDSSHGNAMVTPAPRRTARREMRLLDFGVRFGILITFLLSGIQGLIYHASFIQELGAGDDCLDQRTEAITIRRQFSLHALNGGLIRQLKRPPERVR